MATAYDTLRLLAASGWAEWLRIGVARLLRHPGRPGEQIAVKGSLSDPLDDRALELILALARSGEGPSIMKFPVIISRTGPDTYCAYSPDVPGCVATGNSPGELGKEFHELLTLHLKHLRESGGEVPTPSTVVCTVEMDDDVA